MRIKINIRDIAKKLSFSKNLLAISHKLSAFRNIKHNRGFTLVELLVTLSLFVILTTIVLFSQSKFNGSILLTNLAYDVALTVRQAQTYGVNVRETPKGSFDKAYGIYFDTKKDNKKFILFVEDSKDDGRYNGNTDCKSSADLCLNGYNIKRGNYIKDLQVTSPNCNPDTECSVEELNITFRRPDPDARFKAKKNTGDYFENITEAKIIISSADGSNSRNVLVKSTGQISIENDK